MAGPASPLLIRNADIHGFGLGDLRVAGGQISKLGRDVQPQPADRIIDAHGGALLPGLHDHHIHLAGLAVRGQSVWCGPPDVGNAAQLAARLSQKGTGWIRAIGYHESVLGDLPDAAALDRIVPDRPLRMQHRSGRMWLLNSAALDLLLASAKPPPGMERTGKKFTGRLFDQDVWLRGALGSAPPDFGAISKELSAFGITGITDMTPQNGPQMAGHFSEQKASGALMQKATLAGTLALAQAEQDGWMLGPLKLHLHEAQLPDFAETTALIEAARTQSRKIAIHCVTEVELVFALAVLEAAGIAPGDRIEHASVTPLPLLERIADAGLAVCVQPHFLAERGDRYLADVEPHLHDDLYRLQAFVDAGIALSGGSDAPFAQPDPWRAMHAAMSRTTAAGQAINPAEAVTPETALALFLADPGNFNSQSRAATGETADLCLLSRPWKQVRQNLPSAQVVATIASGRIIHDRLDQAPVQCVPR